MLLPAHQNGQKQKVVVADEMHIVVYDTTGKISGFAESVAGQRTLAVLETYTGLSKNPKAKTVQGGTTYYVDVIYNNNLDREGYWETNMFLVFSSDEYMV